MSTYECKKCGMSVNATCGKCGSELIDDTLEEDPNIQISNLNHHDLLYILDISLLLIYISPRPHNLFYVLFYSFYKDLILNNIIIHPHPLYKFIILIINI